jgi:hypothetical protein
MRARAAVVAIVVLLLSSCSFSFGSTTVSQAELEKQVKATITPDDPSAEFTIACDGTLKGEVDATQDCYATDAEGSTTGLHVKVTEVDGKTVKFSYDPFIAPEDVAAAIKDLAGQQGITVETLTCEEELPGKEGESIVCSGTPVDSVGDLTVTVTSVDGLQVNFNVEQAG